MFMQSIGSVISIMLIIVLGFALERSKFFHDSFAGDISKLITRIALPAAIFVSVLKYLTRGSFISFMGALVYSLGAVFISYVIAYLLVKIFKIRPGRRGIFMNTVANANTIFIGLPLNIALFGDKATSYFLVYYLTNTISTWAIGVILISQDDPTQANKKAKFDWKKLVTPPLLGFLAALIFLLLGIQLPPFINSSLTYVGNLVTPLSLIYIGIVLSRAGLKSIRIDRDTSLALLGRFIISPAVIIILFMAFGASLPLLLKQVLIIQSVVPALAVLPILADESHGDVEYATNIVTTSTLLFVAVVPILSELVIYHPVLV